MNYTVKKSQHKSQENFQENLKKQNENKDFSFIYGNYCKPALQSILALLKLDVSYVRAKREFLYRVKDGDELPVIDLLGGFGSTILGHNHPEIQKALKSCLEYDLPVHAQASIRSHAALLGEKLNQVIQAESPESHPKKYLVHLVNTGTEASEAALKHALMSWKERLRKGIFALKTALLSDHVSPELNRFLDSVKQVQPVFLAIEGSFHGKTAGSLAMTAEKSYGEMYPRPVVETVFLQRDSIPNGSRQDETRQDEIWKVFEKYRIQLPTGQSFSRIAGVIVEVIQGEGGIHVLSQELLSELSALCKQDSVPLIADEIQTGLFRAGKWIASHRFNLSPDLILLGKSLGGGLSKIAAVLIGEDHYVEEFAFKHSSTFAEDDHSSVVALKTIELLESEQKALQDRASQFENRIVGAVEEWMKRFPGVIREVRGMGFMLGIEFDLRSEFRTSHILDTLRESGYLTYVFASFLLHQHGIRVGATLSQPSTLRVEPSAWISEESLEIFLRAFEDLLQKITQGRIFELTEHLFSDSSSPRSAENEVVSPVPPYRDQKSRETQNQGLRRVVFLCHVVDEVHLKTVDPIFCAMSAENRKQFLRDFSSLGGNILLHEQVIEGANGQKVVFELRGIAADSRFFEASLRAGDSVALEKVQKAVDVARQRGATHIGLGQYTSIVSHNGLSISNQGAPVTTGNSLTVGLTWVALQSLLKRRGQSLSDLHVGIVGVAGNICNVYAQLVGDFARQMTVIHREPYAESEKFRKAVKEILDQSKITSQQLTCSHELRSLQDCDVVIVGTNSTRQIISPEHLKQNALVLDVSIPSNIHPSVLKQRPDIEYVQGGFAKLPLGQKLNCPTLFAPEGETFACLAETLAVGLSQYSGSYSLGHLSKQKVLHILKLAEEVGVGLGSIKRISAF